MCAKSPQLCDSVQPYELQPIRFLCPWDSPGKNTGVGCRALLQEIFLIQRLNPHLLRLPALAGGFFTTSTTWEALSRWYYASNIWYGHHWKNPLVILSASWRLSAPLWVWVDWFYFLSSYGDHGDHSNGAIKYPELLPWVGQRRAIGHGGEGLRWGFMP